MPKLIARNATSSDFARMMECIERPEAAQTQAQGYSKKALDAWAERARELAAGTVPEDLEQVEGRVAAKGGRDVYLYVNSGFKEHNPAAAKAIIERL